MGENENRHEMLELHKRVAMHEERFNSVPTKDEMSTAIIAALDRQTMAIEKLEVDMKKRADERQDAAYQLALSELQRLVREKPETGAQALVPWVSIGVTLLIVLLGFSGATPGGSDAASLALDVAALAQ